MRVLDLRSTQPFASIQYPSRALGSVRDFIVHHSEGSVPLSDAHAVEIIKGIHAFHRDTRGWPGYAYNSAVWEDLYVRVRPANRMGWHSAGPDANGNGIGDFNESGFAVCILGNHTLRAPSALTLQTIAEAKALEEREYFSGRNLRLLGHQDCVGTECPGRWWAVGKAGIRLPTPPPQEPIVRIPADYVTKFSLSSDQDITGLIANFEGIVNLVRAQGIEQGRQEGAAAVAQLAEIRRVLGVAG